MNSFHASYPGGSIDEDTTDVPFCFPMIEGASPGASVFGGFWDALKDDGVYVRCTRRSDGVIRYYSTFRMIDRTNLSLTFKLGQGLQGLGFHGTSMAQNVWPDDFGSGRLPG
jgi:hypothetical protein